MKRSLIRSMWTPTLMLAMVSVLGAQSDPGPRPGPAAAGTPITGLSPAEAALFAAGMADYLQLQSVKGPQAGQPDTDNTELGLGRASIPIAAAVVMRSRRRAGQVQR